MASIVHACKIWRHYLHGSQVEFVVNTDHASLQYFFTCKEPSARHQRWAQKLGEFKFTIRYQPGKLNAVADALSRRPAPATLAAMRATDAGSSVTVSASLLQAVQDGYAQDEAASSILADIEQGKPSHFQLVDGLLYDALDRLYVPASGPLREQLLREHHDSPIAGHQDIERTTGSLKRLYYWPRIDEDVRAYVGTCPTCQRTKGSTQKPIGLLRPLEVPLERWDRITMDFIVGLPQTASGHDAITVFVDKLTKMVHFVAGRVTDTAETVAKQMFDHIFRYHGMPLSIVSDRDPRFLSALWAQFFELCGTSLDMSTPYHAQTDGQTERINRWLEDALRAFVNSRQNDWDDRLTALEFAYNDKVQASTGFSPFYLNTGRNPRTPAALLNRRGMAQVRHAGAKQFATQLADDLALARANLERVREKMAKWANKRRRPWDFKVGDEVMLRTDHISLQLTGPSRKLRDKWLGPFVVERIVNPVAVRLGRGNGCSLPDSHQYHPTVHVHWLKPYRDGAEQFPHRAADNTTQHPLWFERDSQGNRVEVYAVDRLLDRKVEGGKTFYYVKWIGFDDERYHTWEPADSLMKGGSEVQRMVQDWEQQAAQQQELSARQTPRTTAAQRRARRGPRTVVPHASTLAETASASPAPEAASAPRPKRGCRGNRKSKTPASEPLTKAQPARQPVVSVPQHGYGTRSRRSAA